MNFEMVRLIHPSYQKAVSIYNIGVTFIPEDIVENVVEGQDNWRTAGKIVTRSSRRRSWGMRY